MIALALWCEIHHVVAPPQNAFAQPAERQPLEARFVFCAYAK